MVPGLILAAGLSSRMGRPKALLKCGRDGDSFVATLAQSLWRGGVSRIFVIGREGHTALEDELRRLAAVVPVQHVVNLHAQEGQLSSVLAGLRAAETAYVTGVMVAPVDTPLVTSGTITRLLSAFELSSAPVVRPIHRGRHGHPVIFGRVLFDELRTTEPSLGARAVVRAHAAGIVNVEVEDPGTVRDVDTPADYERLFGHPPPP